MNNPTNTLKLEHKNYIQINNTVLSQDELKQLNEDQLIKVEHLLNAIINPKKST